MHVAFVLGICTLACLLDPREIFDKSREIRRNGDSNEQELPIFISGLVC